MKSHFWFIFILLGWLIWIFFGNIITQWEMIVVFFVSFILISSILMIFLKKYHIFVLFCLFWSFFWFGYASYHQSNIDYKFEILENYFWHIHQLSGTISQLHKKHESSDSYIVDISEISWQKVPEFRILIRTPKYLSFDYKEKVMLEWQLDKIDNFDPNFDYQKYLLVKWVYGSMSFPYVQTFWACDSWWWGEKIFVFREYFLQKITSFFPEKEAFLLAWILIWARENIPSDMQNDYNNSWLTHLMAVSGFNITILIFFVLFLGKYLPVFIRILFVTLSIIGFTLVVWDSPAVIRASIMGLLWYYILSLWRQSDAFILLLFTASGMLVFQPLYLNYDVSFQLSFLAVIWLLYFQEFWRKICFFLPKFFAIQESFVLTLAAMTTTLPIMIFNFWQVSLFAPIANMLVWWMMPFVMFFWFITLFLSELWYTWAYYLWYIPYFLLYFVNGVAHIFGNLEFALFQYDFWWYAWYLQMVYFILLAFCILYFRYKKTPE